MLFSPSRVVCLSPQPIHSANSSCSQSHQDQDGIGSSVPCSCLGGGEDSGQQHSGFIPTGGFHKAQCEVKRGMNQDLKSLGRDSTLGSFCPLTSSVFSGVWPLDHCLGSPGCQVSPHPPGASGVV